MPHDPVRVPDEPQSIDADVELRAAQAGDAAALVPLVYASGPAAFDYVFAHRERHATGFLRYALEDGRGLLGWRRHHVALSAGRVVASIALYESHELAPLARVTLLQYFRYYRPWAALSVLRRALQIGAMQPPPAAGDFYIAHLSVAAGAQRRGIASRLLTRALRIASARGHRHCALDVAHDNDPALALYAAHGFRCIDERAHHASPSAVPASRRLRADLASADESSLNS